jgi:hypothetical protein
MCAGLTKDTCTPAAGGVAIKCAWSNGKDLIPDHEFCAPMDMTTDIQLIERCVSADVVAACNNGCQWRKGTNSTVVNPTKPEGVPLFTKEFCHPINVNKDTKDTVWDECLKSDTSALCSIAAGCNWSTGKELIPSGDFCAPMDLTDDVKLIQKCVAAPAATDCNQGCQWRHGVTNTTAKPMPTPLFKTDFCHPVTVTEKTVEADWTLCVYQKDATSCSLEKSCNWSTGKELIPTS